MGSTAPAPSGSSAGSMEMGEAVAARMSPMLRSAASADTEDNCRHCSCMDSFFSFLVVSSEEEVDRMNGKVMNAEARQQQAEDKAKDAERKAKDAEARQQQANA